MTPILGILASGISGNLWAPGKDYDSIATVNVGAGGVSTLTFSSIPSTYRHLQIRASAPFNSVGNAQMRFNSDTGTNYSYHAIYGTGANVNTSSGSSIDGFYIAGSNNPGTPTVMVIDILDYANTNKYKVHRSFVGQDSNNTTGDIGVRTGAWLNTNAISSITIYGITFQQYSTFALYGIKG
jgi:hypothetical protein